MAKRDDGSKGHLSEDCPFSSKGSLSVWGVTVIESFNFSSRIDFGATDFLDTVELCQIIFIYIYTS